ncbi:hypothetical protein RQP46_003009 [Phenoliferia psychrophenolica]
MSTPASAQHSDEEPSFKAFLPHLRIAIVGAGIGGLATALACAKAGFENVTVFESANQIAEAPHALGGGQYGAPLWVAHRADLQRVLREGCEATGSRVTIRTGARVTEVDFPGTRTRIGEDEWIESDVILAADGVKSLTRKGLLALHGQRDMAHETGDAAYRIIIPREDLASDPELLTYVDSSIGYRWMGPGGHIMVGFLICDYSPFAHSHLFQAYPMKAHSLFNMVLLHPDVNNTSESWTSKGSKDEMLEFYKSWSPIVRRFLSFVKADEVMEWKLCDHAPLPTWIEGNVALLGDACHPMLPCYEGVRKDRAEKIQASAAATKISLHLPDGPKQVERDALIREAAKGGANPDKWSDSEWQKFMWGTDSTKDMLARIHEVKSGQAQARKDSATARLPQNF